MESIIRIGKVENGQYKVDICLLNLPEEIQSKLKKYFKQLVKHDNGNYESGNNFLRYTSETLLPENYDGSKQNILFVLGNPATHSIKKGMFFFSKINGNRHSFWGKLRNAGLLKMESSIRENAESNETDKYLIRKNESDLRRKYILSGDTSDKYIIGLTTFYSLPSDVGVDAKGVENFFKIQDRTQRDDILNKIRAEEYKRIRNYPFSKSAILIFTQKSSCCYAIKRQNEEPHFKVRYWPIKGKDSSGQKLMAILNKAKKSSSLITCPKIL